VSRSPLALNRAVAAPQREAPDSFAVRLLGVVGILALAITAWRLADVLLLAFSAVLVAALLHALANPLIQRLGLRRPIALSVSALALAAGAGASLWLFGHQVAAQLAALGELLPRAWSLIQSRVAQWPMGADILEDLQQVRGLEGWLMAFAPRVLRSAAGSGAAALIVLFAGFYLAFHPRTYLGGLLRLFPMAHRTRTAEVFQACAKALHSWLVGQLISMLLVGVTTGVGLWLAGVPSPVGLGVLAGLAQFIPVVGPMTAMVPGLILAGADGAQTLLWATLVYVGAMQLEANVVTPLLLRQMVELPMALTLFAVLAMGVLLGPLGVLLATPLAVVACVVVRMVYVEDILEDAPPSASPT
jgi:predicted PurR-regulated permease PerM